MRPKPIAQIPEVKERSSLLNDDSIILEKPHLQEPFFKFIEVKQEEVSKEIEEVNFEEVRPAQELA